jgi:hypothetical protein
MYLEHALSAIDGITTLRPDNRVTANAYNILFLQYDAAAFGGASKVRYITAMQAEGINGINGGYSLPVYRQTPNYHTVAHPVTDRACTGEAIWIRQNMLLGERRDMDDIVAAIGKIHRYRDELQE